MSDNSHGGIVTGLAVADLIHEKILTLNIVLALAAIIAPLLIVLGLKEGIINNLRDDLVQDPVNREIRPRVTQNLDQPWFDRIASNPNVQFVVPGILRGASLVRLEADGHRPAVVDLLPTGPVDPLLLENGAAIPKSGEITVSLPLADDLDLKAGERVTLSVTRALEGRPESESMEMTVASVLGIRGDSLKRIYAPLDLVVDVESYKEGFGIPDRGWPGKRPVPYASYDGIHILTEEPLSALKQRELTVGTGLSQLRELTADQFSTHYGFPLPESMQILELSTIGSSVQSSNIRQVANKLRGRQTLLLPFAEPIETTRRDGASIVLSGYQVTEEQAERYGLPVVEWHDVSAESDFALLSRILLPQAESFSGPELTVEVQGEVSEFSFPLTVAGNAPGEMALIPLPLAAMLRTGRDRQLRYSDSEHALLLERPGFRGFRIYTNDIESVPPLVEQLSADGIETVAKVQEIVGLQRFATGLDRVFLLVALVGLIGGIAALVASLYAAVERKKRDISVMRLLGLSPSAVFSFPVYQGLLIGFLAVIFAAGLYFIFATVMNDAFRTEMGGAQAVRLEPKLFFGAGMLVLGAALISSLFAAYKATRIDPAEAIRVE